MEKVKITGGARVGLANTTWPFATLEVTKDQLVLRSALVGSLAFQPSDVVSIEPRYGILGGGVQIHHTVPTYKRRVVFTAFGSTKSLVRKIEQTGFLNNPNPVDEAVLGAIASVRSKRGGPIKLWFAIAVAVVWNLLFLHDIVNIDPERVHLGIGTKLALGLVFAGGLLMLVSGRFQGLALKKGRTLDEIKKVVYFLMLVSGLMFVFVMVFF